MKNISGNFDSSVMLNTRFNSYFQNSLDELSSIIDKRFIGSVENIFYAIVNVINNNGKIYLCGNGGSAADAQHIAAEFVGRYKVERRALPAIALTTDSSIITAWSNDYSFDTIFSRQVEAVVTDNDLVWGISTSGMSLNILNALLVAKSRGAKAVGFLGKDGGKILPICDYAVVVQSNETAMIQTVHQIAYHAICSKIDEVFG